MLLFEEKCCDFVGALPDRGDCIEMAAGPNRRDGYGLNPRIATSYHGQARCRPPPNMTFLHAPQRRRSKPK